MWEDDATRRVCLDPVAGLGVVVAAEAGIVLEEGVVAALLVLTWSLTHSVKVHKKIHALNSVSNSKVRMQL